MAYLPFIILILLLPDGINIWVFIVGLTLSIVVQIQSHKADIEAEEKKHK